MKNLKKILCIMLMLMLTFALVACGGGSNACDSCVDDDSDGICDVCKKKIENENEEIKDVALIKDGEANCQIVLPSNASTAVRQAVNTGIKAVLRNTYDIEIDVVMEGSDNDAETDVEILIGDIKSRGEAYFLDGHTLGKEGFVFKIVGSKVLVNAGSDEMLVDAIEKFAKDVLIPDDPTNVTMTKNDVVIKPQTNYKITALKVGGTDMKGYTLAVDLTRDGYAEAAQSVQDTIYTRTGYWFDIVDIEQATDKSFILKNIAKVEGDESFKISANGSQLVVECAYDNMIERAMNRFIADNIIVAKGELDFNGTVYKQDISVVYYEDFGAKGDGSTDDFKAMYDTHVFANISGQTVKANATSKYYICNTKQTVDQKTEVLAIPIRTNVDWQGATFIIDDTKLSTKSGSTNRDVAARHIFEALPDESDAMFKITDKQILARIAADGINSRTTSIDLGLDWDGDVLIVPYCSAHKVFRRKGPYSGYAGAAMHEIIVVKADGKVSEETPIIFDYTEIDYIEVYKLDPTCEITIENGNFITYDTRENQMVDGVYGGGYIYRGMNIMRSFTTVQNISHSVTGGFTIAERLNGFEGNITNGFYAANYASNVTFKDCIIPARMSYNSSSTYNFNATHVNKIVMDSCVQSNFWITIDPDTHEITPATVYDKDAIGYARKASEDAVLAMNPYVADGKSLNLYYGFCGSNYCKNMEYINSTASRFDAHAALYNGKVVNCNITDLELTGYGEFLFAESNFYPYNTTTPLFFLRSDYGYHWDGDLIARNLNVYTYDGTTPRLITSTYSNWYFGYTCAFPNIVLDNVDIYSMETGLPRSKGYEVVIASVYLSEIGKHLTEISTPVILGVVDDDGDGFIDEPLYDINRDGRVTEEDEIDIDNNGDPKNTNLNYYDYYDAEKKELKDLEYRRGITYNQSTQNVNIVKPPKYIKIINNDGVNGSGGYMFSLADTAGKGVSDGAWWDDVENYGGFFGDTKFYYGSGANDYFLGTKGKDPTNTFMFVPPV